MKSWEATRPRLIQTGASGSQDLTLVTFGRAAHAGGDGEGEGGRSHPSSRLESSLFLWSLEGEEGMGGFDPLSLPSRQCSYESAFWWMGRVARKQALVDAEGDRIPSHLLEE